MNWIVLGPMGCTRESGDEIRVSQKALDILEQLITSQEECRSRGLFNETHSKVPV
jgi:hypothetical protein